MTTSTAKTSTALTPSQQTWVQRLSLAAGSLAAVTLAPKEVQAAIVYVPTAPAGATQTLGINGQFNWDIDGNGTAEFSLFGTASNQIGRAHV